MQHDSFTSFASNWNATADRNEDAFERLQSDLRWYLKRRHSGDYRKSIAGIVAELRQFF